MRAGGRRLSRWLTIIVLLTLVLPSVGVASVERDPLAHDPANPPIVVLEPVLRGLDAPVFVTHAGDGSGRLFVVERGGLIRVARDGELLAEPFLDLRDVSHTDDNHQGLLGMAFHPAFADNGLFYVAFTAGDGANTVSRYQRSSDNPDRGDKSSVLTILAIPDRLPDHNLGMLAFGPDGYVYLSIGDEGTGTPGDPFGHAQNLSTLFGSILRIDVDGEEPYATPPNNPFVGVDGARAEIWATGLRSPWRFSFDRATGDLYVTDVGQDGFEEVNFQPAGSVGGANYGWSIMEGIYCYPGDQECDREGLTLPVYNYSHANGCSITGGYVYRGASSPLLTGDYLFADFCSGQINALEPGDDESWTPSILLTTNLLISSFGEDEAGEVYLTDLRTGSVFKIVALDSYPQPVIESLSRTSAVAGESGFNLQLNGHGFVPESVVEWNGVAREATFRDSTTLTVVVSRTELRLAREVDIRVVSPEPGGASAPVRFTILAPELGDPAFVHTWQRTDEPVVGGAADRTWIWGPGPNSAAFMEEYADSPGGERLVQYFDKSRMELADPNGDPESVWSVTNGLLARELMTGLRQDGDDSFEQLAPPEHAVAGDPTDSAVPTYATFGELMDEPALAAGATVTWTVDRDGTIGNDPSLAAHGVTAATHVPETGHSVASVFWEFMQSDGVITVDDALVTGQLFLNPFYATGLPLTEAYWTTVAVAGQQQLVLVQAFERRVMTWTPGNPIGWQVEAGNVGQHYYAWRYGE